jgi:putative serine protease PepD
MYRPRFRVAAAALAAGVLAAGGGAALVAVEHDGPATTTATAAASSSLAAVTSSTASTGLTVAKIAARDSPGVVELEVTTASSDPFGRGSTSSAVGTGFVVDTDGHVVTNAHVIDGAQSITVRFSDGATYDATVVGSDLSTDVAVVQVDAPAAQLHPLSFGDSSALEVGDAVVAIGSPYGLDTSVSTGIVSAVDREIIAPDESSTISGAIQTDAAINHGNSGGPLLDANGKVIGITAQIESESGGNDGVGFAVPSNTVRSVVAQLLADGTAQPAVLGVQAQTLPAAVAAELGEASGVALPRRGCTRPAARRRSAPRRTRPAATCSRRSTAAGSRRCRSCARSSPPSSPARRCG